MVFLAPALVHDLPVVDWRDQAACAESPGGARRFFPVGVTGSAAVQIEDAKAVCGACPVVKQCLDFAITTNQEYGVWGGTSEEERRALRRQWRAEQRVVRQARRESELAARQADRAAKEALKAS